MLYDRLISFVSLLEKSDEITRAYRLSRPAPVTLRRSYKALRYFNEVPPVSRKWWEVEAESVLVATALQLGLKVSGNYESRLESLAPVMRLVDMLWTHDRLRVGALKKTKLAG